MIKLFQTDLLSFKKERTSTKRKEGFEGKKLNVRGDFI